MLVGGPEGTTLHPARRSFGFEQVDPNEYAPRTGSRVRGRPQGAHPTPLTAPPTGVLVLCDPRTPPERRLWGPVEVPTGPLACCAARPTGDWVAHHKPPRATESEKVCPPSRASNPRTSCGSVRAGRRVRVLAHLDLFDLLHTRVDERDLYPSVIGRPGIVRGGRVRIS